MQVGGLVHAEGDLAALDFLDCLRDVWGHGAGLRVRHQTTWAEDAGNAANLGHLVWGCDRCVEVGPAALDLLDQVCGANEVGACFFSGGGVRAFGEHDDADVLTGAVWQGDGAANQLVGLAWVNAQAQGDVHGGVVVLGGGCLDQLRCLQRGVLLVAVDLGCRLAVCLGVLAHESSNLGLLLELWSFWASKRPCHGFFSERHPASPN